MIRAFWCLSPNFGDALTPWIIERMTKKFPVYTAADAPEKKFILSGSVLNWANEASIVWGAGIAHTKDAINPDADLRAVRGPLALARARACGFTGDAALGDPGMILPLLYSPNVGVKHKVGAIPHYVDHDRWDLARADDDVLVINVLAPVEKVIDAICSCETIVSSSLHGLVVAAAYGRPFRWVRMSDRLLGDGTKFADFLLSVGVTPPKPAMLAGHETRDVLQREMCVARFDAAAFYATCPLLKKSEV